MEFALILPISTLMLCGTLQYGVLFYTWNAAYNGARNAARAVAVGRLDAAGGQSMMLGSLPPWVQGGGDRNCGGGNGDASDTGGYGPGGCGAGNGNGNGSGNGKGNGNGGGTSGGGGVTAEVTDAAVGGEVVARMSFPSAMATFLPLAPMPDTVSVQVRMVKEA